MKKIMLLAMLTMCEILSAQTTQQTFCTTPQSSRNLDIFSSSIINVVVENNYTLRIYIHVVRRSNGTGGQSVDEVNEALAFLDSDFAEHGIHFEREGGIDYIDADSLFNSPSPDIFTVNNNSDGIDIYIFSDAGTRGGKANGVGESSEFYISGSYWRSPFGSLVRSRVMSHEMGHVLFLWHTHHGTSPERGDTLQCAELVDGSNGAICGDYISDTPADPLLNFNVIDSTCIWTGSGTDANGDSYNPDEELIMAYTHPDCMSYFSKKQGERMRTAIATLPFLQQTVICEEVSFLNHIVVGNEEVEACSVLLNFVAMASNSNLDVKVSNMATLQGEINIKLGTSLNIEILD